MDESMNNKDMDNPMNLSPEDLEIQRKRRMLRTTFGLIPCEKIIIEGGKNDEPAGKN